MCDRKRHSRMATQSTPSTALSTFSIQIQVPILDSLLAIYSTLTNSMAPIFFQSASPIEFREVKFLGSAQVKVG